jgi:hypothetical protein
MSAIMNDWLHEGTHARRTLCILVLSAAFSIVIAGCSTDTDHGTLQGNVTLDGEPLPTGLIRFIPADGQTPTADATISDGKFTAKVPVGEKRVSISAPKVVGTRKFYDTPDAPTVDIVEELLPARYNAQSELTITVTAGDQPQDFALKSGK